MIFTWDDLISVRDVKFVCYGSVWPSESKIQIQVHRCDFRLDRRHFILIARRRHNFRFRARAHNTGTHARTYVYDHRRALRSRLSLDKKLSIKSIKNEIGCRDDTVPKRRSESMQQSSATQSLHLGGCGRLLHALTPPCSAFLYLQFLARCHPYILLHF